MEKLWSTEYRQAGLLLLFLAGCAILFVLIQGASGLDICAQNPFTDAQKSTIASLDAIVDLGLKLSTALVGFGAAALLGVKFALRASPMMRLSIALGTMLFAQSAFYAFWWRYGVAQAHLDQCFRQVLSPQLQYRFNAHFYFFAAGLVALGIVVIGILFRKNTAEDFDT
jgi:hypothetical protein